MSNFMTTKGSAVKWTNMDDLFKNHKVGIIETYGYPESVQKAMKKYPNLLQ